MRVIMRACVGWGGVGGSGRESVVMCSHDNDETCMREHMHA